MWVPEECDQYEEPLYWLTTCISKNLHMRIQRPKPTHAMYSLLSMNLLSCVWFNGNCFSGVKSFQGKLFSRKGKCIQAVWLSRNSFYGKSIPVFGSFKHFTKMLSVGDLWLKFFMQRDATHFHTNVDPIKTESE